MLLMKPAFKMHSTSPALLNATEMGNCPLVQTGLPICASEDGSLSEMLKIETVSEPSLRESLISSLKADFQISYIHSG